MKIYKLQIGAFGKLKDFNMEFMDGFQIIKQDNEFGKSTIMAFIKLMFYSKINATRDTASNIRKKYLPWDNSKMHGAIEFTHAGASYRLEKQFGNSPASDKVLLMNMNNGTEIILGKEEEAGMHFFGMDWQGFEKSIFIGGTGGFTGDSGKDSIADKLSNLSTAADEDISPQRVMNNLTEAKETLVSKSGRTGKLVHCTEEIDRIRTQLANTIEDGKRREEEYEQYEQANRNRRRTEMMLAVLEERLQLQKLDDLVESGTHLQEMGEKLREMELPFDRAEEFFEKCDRLFFEINQNEKRLTELQRKKHAADLAIKEETDDCKAQVKNLEEQISSDTSESLLQQKEKLSEEMSEQERMNRRKKSIIKVMFPAGIVTLAAASALFVLKLSMISLLTLVPLTFLFLIIGFACVGMAANGRQRVSMYAKEIEELAGHTEEYEKNMQELEKLRMQLTILNAKQSEETALCEMLIKELSDAKAELAALFPDMKEATLLQESLMKVTQLKEIFQNIKNEEIRIAMQKKAYGLEGGSYEEFIEAQISGSERMTEKLARLKQFGEDEAEEFKNHVMHIQNVKELSEETARVSKEFHALEEQVRKMGERLRPAEGNPITIERELKELEEQTQDMTEYYDALCIAQEEMGETIEQIRQSFGGRLNDATGEIMNELTDGKYINAMVSRNYEIMVSGKEDIHYRNWKYLSNGTIDQLYLSLRLAITKCITEGGESLPIFLDDVLSQYDDVRCRRTLAFLENFSKDGQMVLFTCHSLGE